MRAGVACRSRPCSTRPACNKAPNRSPSMEWTGRWRTRRRISSRRIDIDHAPRREVMLAYGMNGEDLPVLNGFPLRLVVPGYYRHLLGQHLNEITVIDNVFDGFWMKTAYRIPDTPVQLRRAGHRAQGDESPINRFTVRSFITNVTDGAKLKTGRDDAERNRFRRRQGHQGGGRSRSTAARPGRRRSSAKTSENIRSANGFAGEARRGCLTSSRFARQTLPATPQRASHAGIRPATCATSSKPFASPRREGEKKS